MTAPVTIGRTMTAFDKIRAELLAMAKEAETEGRVREAFQLGIIARRIEAQVEMTERGVAS